MVTNILCLKSLMQDVVAALTLLQKHTVRPFRSFDGSKGSFAASGNELLQRSKHRDW